MKSARNVQYSASDAAGDRRTIKYTQQQQQQLSQKFLLLIEAEKCF